MNSYDVPTLRMGIRSHLRFGLAVVALLVFGVFGWAASAEISGAVIAQGHLVVESSVKSIQHPSGGVVGEILVHDGDRVQEGDVLIRLDATITKANLSIISRQLDELTARKARLEAERYEKVSVVFPSTLSARSDNPEVQSILKGEADLFMLRKAVRQGQIAQLEERITQLRDEVAGLVAQSQSKTRENELLLLEVENARKLWQKGLSASVKLTEFERQQAKLGGDAAQLTATIAGTRGQIAEVQLQILEIQHDLGSKVADELRDVESQIGELQERRVAAEDQLRRIDIRATKSGVVTQSTVHSVGGVIAAGDVLMQIVPENDRLTVETRINPRDIDQVYLGQTARVRFSSFSQGTTPEIAATVSLVSADIEVDPQSGLTYYTARLALAESDIAKLGNLSLVPGMPVETFIQTGMRRVASYFLKPFSDQMERVFREQ